METVLNALGRASWQGGIAIIAVWTLCRLLPRIPAAIRCTLWRLTYIKLLLSVFLAGAVLLPVLPPNPPAATPIVQEAFTERDVPLVDTPSPVPVISADAPPVHPPALPPISLAHILLMLYGLGLAVSVTSLYRAWRRTQALMEGATPVTDGSLSSFCAELAERLKLRRLPGLWTTEKITSPLLLGVLRETILLPEAWAATAPPAEIRLALAHELAHIRRRDLAWEWLGALVQVLFFFHPLVWLARREERAVREMACDAIALSMTGEPASVYSRLLYQIAAMPAGGYTISVGALGSGEKGRLLLMRITELGNNAPSLHYLWFGTVAATFILLMTGVPWQLTAQQRTEPQATRERIVGVAKTPDGKTAGKITGTVRNETTIGKPVPNVTVWYERFDAKTEVRGSRGKVRTDSDGRYEITGLLSGRYRIGTEGPDKETVASYYPEIFIYSGMTAHLDFVMTSGFIVHGRVVDARTRQPLSGIEVRCGDAGDTQLDLPFLTTTDADGRYRLRVPGGGIQLVLWSGENARVGIQGNYERKKILGYDPDEPREVTVDFAVQTRPKLHLSGSVVGPDGKPVPDAILEYWDGDDLSKLAVGPLGIFNMTASSDQMRLPVYVLVHSGNLSATTVIHEWNPGPLNLRLTARPRPVLAGSVVDRKGKPVVGALVLAQKTPIEPANPNPIFFDFRDGVATTDAQGRFTWTCWPEFRYRVAVSSGNGKHRVPERGKEGLILTPGKATSLKIILP